MLYAKAKEKEYDIKYFILLSFSRNWEKTLEYFNAYNVLFWTDVVENV